MPGYQLSKLLTRDQHPVLDGAMATELEKLGVDTTSSLWSASALLHQPDAVTSVHRAYFEAGANVATTNTYQANIAAFVQLGLSEAEAANIIRRAVHSAVTARHEVTLRNPNHPMVVAGSVGPYGAFLADGSEYTGAYRLTEGEYKDFHRSRIQLLLEAGVDCLALETMPNAGEVRALLSLLSEEFPQAEAWLSFSVADAEHLCDGTALSEVLPEVNSCDQVLAVGVNCLDCLKVTPVLQVLAQLTHKPLLAYPNSGETYDPVTKTWQQAPAHRRLGELAGAWGQAGVSLVGGCCRTSPSDIAELAAWARG
ncbi:MAG: homocysteine S-methyltransferase [Rothia sp. (in: high G+C Gram-positive bacteria)]|nr:homocysteine S-methyltransferase [Rothia sp. (in: high G+C Gram-positive bacteria)]